MPFDSVQTLVRELGFPAYYLLDATLTKDAPDGITTLLLLLYPYDSWGKADTGCARISTYYFAAQDAYLKAGEMVRELTIMGESARLCNDVRLKPLLSGMKDFAQGRNTLHYHKEYGSRFHMQVIGLYKHHPMDESILREKNESSNMCGTCKRCIQACPANALAEEGVLRDKCLRQHMQSGKPIPVPLRPLMGNRLLGCDVCQQACPYNTHLPEGETAGECFPIAKLLEQDEAAFKCLSRKIGRNMAITNRILNQAAIIAGNSREKAYLPILEKLCCHPSPAVSEHAKWAVKVLSNEAGETTT
jgi:formate hydrogenlyase subunit 6/NADH:ubiquinone oxidoreductase subunit I